MKYTIQGFSQLKLLEMKLDVIDVTLLRYFIDFRDTDKMVSEIIDNEKYYWINYKALIDALPILNLGKDRVYRRFKNMAELKILLHATKKNGGTFSFYAVGPKYMELIYSEESHSAQKPEGYGAKTVGATVEKPEGYGAKTVGATVEKPEGYGANNGTKDSSIKDTSIKNNSSIKDSIDKLFNNWNLQKIIEHKNISKAMQSEIKTALSIYSEEQIIKAIKNYATIVNSDEYYFTYKWSLDKFLKRGLSDFLDWGICSQNYLKNKIENKYGKKESGQWNIKDSEYLKNNDIDTLEKKLLGWE